MINRIKVSIINKIDEEKMHRTDMWSGAVACLIGTVCLLWVIPQTTESSQSFTLQPALYPSVAAWVITVAGGLLCFLRFFQRHQADPAVTGLTWGNVRHLVIIAFSLALVLWGFSTLGFVISGIAFIIIIMLYIGERRPAILLLTAFLTPLTVYILFEKWLGMPLP